MIAAPTFKMAKSARINRYNIWIPVVSALLIWLLGFSPIYVIILSGLGGYLYGRYQKKEVVTRYEWLSSSDFTDIIAISQMTPGPIGINSATYVGYTAMVNAGYSHAVGILGSTVATFSVVLPSFILMIFISRFFLKYQRHPAVEAVFNGLRPGVVGLLAAAALVLMNGENFGTDTYQVVISILLFIGCFIASNRYKVNPILLIVCSGVLGYFIY